MSHSNKSTNLVHVAVKFFHLYSFLADQDIKNRFRRSVFGIWWLVIQNLSFVLIANFIWSRMFGINSAEFIPFLTMGLAIWNAIIAANVESCGIFLQNRNYVQQFPLPRQIFIFRFVWAQLYYFWISICAGMVIIILFSKIYLMGLLYAVPGLLILSAYFVFSSTVLAYAGCRYRDLQYALGNLFSILFIVTPIIFPTEILAKKGINVVLYLNPFISLIEIIRYPLLHGQVPAMQYYVTSLALVLGLAVTRIFVIKYWDKKLIFWL